ncbi:MAG: type II secretion system F family protein [Gammaproteobacteria bacterium]
MAQKHVEEVFEWAGKDKNGRSVKGEIVGRSPTLVKAALRVQGIKPSRVRKKAKPLMGGKKQKITQKDVTIFGRQLATMIASGVPLVQGFDIVAGGHENPEMRSLLNEVRADIAGGNGLADSLQKHPKYFDELFCNLIRSGEKSGTLETMLDRLAIYMEKTEAIKSKIKKALFYPIAVIVVAFIVTCVLLLYVVPQFEELFADFGAELPAFTRLVLDISETLQQWWYIVFGTIFAVALIFRQAFRTSPDFQRQVHGFLLKAPVFGNIFTKAAIARYSRTLSTMFAAGVPLIEAMDQVSGATGNLIYGDAIQRMKEDVSTGQRLNQAMYKTQLFPQMVVQMVAIGEESGALDAMLAKVADFYEQEVDDAIDGLSSLMEPLIMAFLGVILGGLIVAMYLPIFQMGDAI